MSKEGEEHPPKLCPNCGSGKINWVTLISGDGRESLIYDTYCYDCRWSGDISPDADLDFHDSEFTTNHEEETE